MSCFMCGRQRWMAQGTHLKQCGSHCDISVASRKPICTDCRDRLAKAAMKAVILEMDLNARGEVDFS
jgi:hypothetical protein